jgi:hypothetical protein
MDKMVVGSPARKEFQRWWTKYRKHPDLKYVAYVRGPAMDAFQAGLKYAMYLKSEMR